MKIVTGSDAAAKEPKKNGRGRGNSRSGQPPLRRHGAGGGVEALNTKGAVAVNHRSAGTGPAVA